MRAAALLAFAVWACGSTAAVPQGRKIEVAAAPALTLDAIYFPPSEGGDRLRHAAVILMHGCGGLYGRDGAINPRHALWADTLVREGYAVLLVDSFGGRRLREICTQANRDRSLRAADRVRDAWAAKNWLALRPEIDPARIALMGWSHGGSATLYTLREAPTDMAPFAAAVALYPGCAALSRQATAYRPHSPLLILIGGADDWTPAEPCRALADRVPEISLQIYPGVYHDFDNPAARLRVRTDVPNGVRPGGGVTVGPDPEAREDALRRVIAFFHERLKP